MVLWILWRYWTIYFIRVINQLIVLGTSLLDMVGWTYTGSDQGWNLTLEFCRDIFSEKCEKRDNQFNGMNWSSFGWRLHRARWGILKMLGTLMTKWEGNHLISFAWPQDSLQLFRSWVLVDFWTRSFFGFSTLKLGLRFLNGCQAFGTFSSHAFVPVPVWLITGWCWCGWLHGWPWSGAVCAMASAGHLATWYHLVLSWDGGLDWDSYPSRPAWQCTQNGNGYWCCWFLHQNWWPFKVGSYFLLLLWFHPIHSHFFSLAYHSGWQTIS